MSARGIIVGAARSGTGKTSVTIGLLRALRRRGISVRGAKSGPDYIDPGFHAAATGAPGVNLDSWAMRPALLNALAHDAAHACEVLVIESAMGLFDGIDADRGRTGAASDLAALFRLPVLLVLDVSGQSRTAAAMVKGFASYDEDVRIAGVILNRVASERHRLQATSPIERLGIPVVGAIFRNPDMALPERHLGLVQAREHRAIDGFIETLADIMEASIDVDRVIALAAPFSTGAGDPAGLPPPGQRIALADDAAFSFLYPHVLRFWRDSGAEIVPFSPLADEVPRADCDVCWLPGGYPELHAGLLAHSIRFREGMKRFALTRQVHGECGGFMVLGEALEDADGQMHPMLGLLGHVTSFARRKMNLGYRQASLRFDCALGRRGDTIRGHEFHYAAVISPGPDEPLADLADGLGNPLGPAGGRRANVSGSFFHAIAGDVS